MRKIRVYSISALFALSIIGGTMSYVKGNPENKLQPEICYITSGGVVVQFGNICTSGISRCLANPCAGGPIK